MRVLPLFIALSIIGCSAETAPAPDAKTPPNAAEITAPSGAYVLDPSHASLVFRVDHLGFSHYTASFDRFDAALNFDPSAPETMTLSASIDVSSLDIPTPPDGFLEELLGVDWFDADTHPEIIFHSNELIPTGPNSARVDGNMTMLGTTVPLSFDVTYKGGYAGYPPYDPNARIGFIAEGKINRSHFGLDTGLPPEGSTMGVADLVTFRIDAEFTGPPAEEANNNP